MDLKRQSEIENLARTLKASRLAHSESEAMRMAEDMLSTTKKVADDFTKRDKAIYGEQRRNPEVENAHKIMEQITGNMAKGRSNVRIDIKELDLDKPLKELFPKEEEAVEADDDGERPEVNDLQFPSIVEPKKHVFEAGHFDEDDDDSEEEKAKEEPEDSHFEEANEVKSVDEMFPVVSVKEEEKPAESEDFSVRELDTIPPAVSEEERKRKIEEMEESKIDLSAVFGQK